MATLSDYDDQRAKVGAIALKVYNDYGRERALQMYWGAIDALVYAALSLNHGAGIRLVTDNTKPTNSDGVAA